MKSVMQDQMENLEMVTLVAMKLCKKFCILEKWQFK